MKRAVGLARGFQGEGPRAVAMIAIARAILEPKKPVPVGLGDQVSAMRGPKLDLDERNAFSVGGRSVPFVILNNTCKFLLSRSGV